jgi:hypothetical protein
MRVGLCIGGLVWTEVLSVLRAGPSLLGLVGQNAGALRLFGVKGPLDGRCQGQGYNIVQVGLLLMSASRSVQLLYSEVYGFTLSAVFSSIHHYRNIIGLIVKSWGLSWVL